jgi:AmmeMemoRadiSam system protein A
VSGELSPEARRLLLALARRAVEAQVAGEPLSRGALLAERAAFPELLRPCGAFVTIRQRGGELRGCVGFVEARHPLADAVERAAAAASADDRFEPIRREEIPGLVLDVSVLGPLTPIVPEAVEVGRHGLVIGWGGRRGLLLPQVAIENGWDRLTFLDQTCRKAGLPLGTWRNPRVELLAFAAIVFGEE